MRIAVLALQGALNGTGRPPIAADVQRTVRLEHTNKFPHPGIQIGFIFRIGHCRKTGTVKILRQIIRRIDDDQVCNFSRNPRKHGQSIAENRFSEKILECKCRRLRRNLQKFFCIAGTFRFREGNRPVARRSDFRLYSGHLSLKEASSVTSITRDFEPRLGPQIFKRSS